MKDLVIEIDVELSLEYHVIKKPGIAKQHRLWVLDVLQRELDEVRGLLGEDLELLLKGRALAEDADDVRDSLMPHLHVSRFKLLPNALNLRVVLKRIKSNRITQEALLRLK